MESPFNKASCSNAVESYVDDQLPGPENNRPDSSEEVSIKGDCEMPNSGLQGVAVRAEEYHATRMEHLKSEHTFKIGLLQLDLEMKKERHSLKMNILQKIRDTMEQQQPLDLSGLI